MLIRRIWLSICCVVFACSSGSAAHSHSNCVDLALILAVDASNSISDHEFDMQIEGTVRALRSPRVRQAMADAGAVAIAMVIWSDHRLTATKSDWVVVHAEEHLSDAVHRMLALPREQHGNTDIGHGLTEAIAHFEMLERCVFRRVIDISGDGVQTQYVKRADAGKLLVQTRLRADLSGITINGLAIGDDEIVTYFANDVIAGFGAFVLPAAAYESFEEAMIEKLYREISPARVSAISP